MTVYYLSLWKEVSGFHGSERKECGLPVCDAMQSHKMVTNISEKPTASIFWTDFNRSEMWMAYRGRMEGSSQGKQED
jgi:hypothetical protein